LSFFGLLNCFTHLLILDFLMIKDIIQEIN
jgi:hypothetical protein